MKMMNEQWVSFSLSAPWFLGVIRMVGMVGTYRNGLESFEG